MTWPGVGVDAEESVDAGFDPGLLADLADGGLGDALAGFHLSAGDRPQAVVGSFVEEDAAGVVEDDR